MLIKSKYEKLERLKREKMVQIRLWFLSDVDACRNYQQKNLDDSVYQRNLHAIVDISRNYRRIK